MEDPLRHLSTKTIIQGCQAESNQPRSRETGYCFELFRRALEDKEQIAWEAIDEQYRHLILYWICDHSPDLPQEEIEQVAPEALPKFWQALTRSAVPLTSRFRHIGEILKYLKQCTISVLRDYERRIQRVERVKKCLETADQSTLCQQADAEQELLARINREQLLQLVREWVKTCVTDCQERKVLCLSYEYGLTPAEIAAHYPRDFPDAQTVRRIKERILKRARRALRNVYQENINSVAVKGENGRCVK